MSIKSSQTLVEEAQKNIETLTPSEVKKLHENNEITLIDVRDIRELWKEGTVERSKHIPRGMLEFWLDPSSTYYQSNKIQDIKKIVLFCALGWRSALATKSLVDMGFKNVAHVNGGFDALKKSGANEVYVFITHAVLGGEAVKKIKSSKIKKLIITDTINNSQKIKNNNKIEVLSISSLMSEAIKRIANSNSVSDLFN